MMKYNWLAAIVSIALLVALLIYSNISEIFGLLLKSNVYFIFIGVLLWSIGATIRGLRWKFLLKASKINVSLKDSLHAYIPGLFLSDISPGKVGDAFRSVLLKAIKKKSISKSLPSIFVERVLDLFVLIFISLSGVSLLSEKLFLPLLSLILIYSIAFFLGTFILVSPQRTKFILSMLTFFISEKSIKSKLHNFSANLSKSFKMYKDFKIWIIGLAYSFLVWLIEGTILMVAFKTIGASLPIWLSMFVVGVSVLFGAISFLPGGLGVNEAITLVLLSNYGLKPAEIMAAMLLARFYGFWIYAILGSIILATSKYKIR